MENAYKVCAKDCVTEFIEKKSRFISYLACVRTEGEAKEFIAEIQKKHRDATHNCYAYRLRTPRVERFSDDGEPAGTAGMPMLEVMKKEDVYDVCVVVTRYFGGILLGGGGLIRAYSKGVSNALGESGYAVYTECVKATLSFGYAAFDRVQKILDKTVHNKYDSEFGENITLCISLKASEAESVFESLRDNLAGDIEIEASGGQFDSFK